MPETAQYVAAPRWARRLIVVSWPVLILGLAGFWLKGDPHTLFWIPILVFLLLQGAAETFAYENRSDDPLRVKFSQEFARTVLALS